MPRGHEAGTRRPRALCAPGARVGARGQGLQRQLPPYREDHGLGAGSNQRRRRKRSFGAQVGC